MSSQHVKVDFGSGGGKRRHSRQVGNAKAAGPQELGRLKGPMTGPAYGIRSSAITAYHAKTPQQQLAWRNRVIVRARALGILCDRSDAASEATALRAQAQDLRQLCATGGFRGYTSRNEEDEIKELEAEAKAVVARGETGMPLEDCLAFSALAARMPTDQLTVFCLGHKGSRFAVHCYVEASQPKWNVVRFLTHEENAKLVTIGESLATGAALPGLLGKVAAELAAAAATARPQAAAARAPKVQAPRPPSLRERYQAHGRTLSLESKLRWTRRIFSHLHPNWTRKWSGDYTREHGETLRDEVKEHFYCLAQVAHEDYEDARKRIARCWFRPYATSAPTWGTCEAQLEARREARAATQWELQLALNGKYLANHFPTMCAILHWGRGSLVHPAVAVRKAEAKKVQKREKRGNAREREAAERAALAAFRALPDYIAPTAASAYSQPMEQIQTLRLGNLPLASSQEEQRALREAMAALVTKLGGSVAKERGATFTPLRNRVTAGYGFVKCSAPANAQRVLRACEKDEEGRCFVEMALNGVTSLVIVELAASERKSKEQMEAAKAKDAAERAAAAAKVRALMVSSIRPSTKVELLEAPPAPAPAPAAPALVKVCLGATVKARREAEAAAAAAALKAEVQAMFSAPLGGVVRSAPKAPVFKQSFAASAKKGATAAKLEVVDEFTVKVNGVVKRIEAVEGSELARAQAVIRRQMAEDAARAKKAARDKAYAQWEKDKAETEASGWDAEEWVEPE
jgi:hypothetical protein